jgi:hypothetical protein
VPYKATERRFVMGGSGEGILNSFVRRMIFSIILRNEEEPAIEKS